MYRGRKPLNNRVMDKSIQLKFTLCYKISNHNNTAIILRRVNLLTFTMMSKYSGAAKWNT